MKEDKENFTFEEKVVADQVADEILTVEVDKENRRYFFLVVLFLICLIFLVSSVSFSVFNTYYNGGNNNVIDVGVDVIIDDNSKDDDGDKNDKNNNNSNVSDRLNDNNSNQNVPSNNFGNVSAGSVLFSFNEGSNYINMVDVYPMADDLGKKLTGNNQYFDFNVSAVFNNVKSGKLVYEISLVPVSGNTIDSDDVRVYLTENGKSVSILKSDINDFNDLPDSKFHSGGKVIYKKYVTKNFYGNYVFRMWLSYDASVSDVAERFGCKVAVDAYYK